MSTKCVHFGIRIRPLTNAAEVESAGGAVQDTAAKVLGVDLADLTPTLVGYGVNALGALLLLFVAWIAAMLVGR